MPTTTSSLPVEQPRRPAMKGVTVGPWGPAKALSPVRRGPAVPCQQEDPALWFSTIPAELNLAKAYCRGCRNRQPCLAGALERAEPVGVWGGEIFENGRIIEFKRPRGRPRKSLPDLDRD